MVLMNRMFTTTFVPTTIDPLVIMISLGNSETTYGPFKIAVKSIEIVGDLFGATETTLEKKATEHCLKLSDHLSVCFLPRYTLSMVQIRTFRGSSLGFKAYSVRKLGLLTDNGSVSVAYYDFVVYRENLWSFYKRALFVYT